MTIQLLIVLSLLSLSLAAPLTSYDQRQEGELNVKVDLDNFVIVLARPSPSSSGLDLLSSMASLFADGAKRAAVHASDDSNKPDEEDDKSKNLEDVSLEAVVTAKPNTKEEAVIVLVQSSNEDKSSQKSDEVARTLRDFKEASHASEKSKSWLPSEYKFVDSVEQPQSLKLIGDAIEGCGPGRSRDRFGICQQEPSD